MALALKMPDLSLQRKQLSHVLRGLLGSHLVFNGLDDGIVRLHDRDVQSVESLKCNRDFLFAPLGSLVLRPTSAKAQTEQNARDDGVHSQFSRELGLYLVGNKAAEGTAEFDLSCADLARAVV